MSLIPKKGTVYVVDDDEAVRDSLQWLLEGKDYRVRCFDSAETFLNRYDPKEVACLIVDIRMAGMSGLELQDKLIEKNSPLPVVFITGHGDVPMAVDTMKKGAMDFIQKPFKEDELVPLVEQMLEKAKLSFADHQNAASRELGPGDRTNKSRTTWASAARRLKPIAPTSWKSSTPTPWPTCSKLPLDPIPTKRLDSLDLMEPVMTPWAPKPLA